MAYKNRFSIFTLFKVLFLLFIVCMILFPLLHIVAVSFSSNKNILNHEVSIWPKGFNINMYKYVFNNAQILTAYKNTIIYTLLGTALSLTVTSIAAYALSKNKLVLRKFFMILILITMFFQGGLIPSFLLIKRLGIFNSIWAVILPGLVSSWNLIIMRSFFVTFPAEIEESGMIDGLNDIGILWKLVLPLSKAVVATMGLFYAVGLWNSYFGPFIYLDSPQKFPLQVYLWGILSAGSGLSNKQGGVSRDGPMILESLKYACIIVSVVPIIIVYPFLQKYFVKGVMIGSLKG